MGYSSLTAHMLKQHIQSKPHLHGHYQPTSGFSTAAINSWLATSATTPAFFAPPLGAPSNISLSSILPHMPTNIDRFLFSIDPNTTSGGHTIAFRYHHDSKSWWEIDSLTPTPAPVVAWGSYIGTAYILFPGQPALYNLIPGQATGSRPPPLPEPFPSVPNPRTLLFAPILHTNAPTVSSLGHAHMYSPIDHRDNTVAPRPPPPPPQPHPPLTRDRRRPLPDPPYIPVKSIDTVTMPEPHSPSTLPAHPINTTTPAHTFHPLPKSSKIPPTPSFHQDSNITNHSQIHAFNAFMGYQALTPDTLLIHIVTDSPLKPHVPLEQTGPLTAINSWLLTNAHTPFYFARLLPSNPNIPLAQVIPHLPLTLDRFLFHVQSLNSNPDHTIAFRHHHASRTWWAIGPSNTSPQLVTTWDTYIGTAYVAYPGPLDIRCQRPDQDIALKSTLAPTPLPQIPLPRTFMFPQPGPGKVTSLRRRTPSPTPANIIPTQPHPHQVNNPTGCFSPPQPHVTSCTPTQAPIPLPHHPAPPPPTSAPCPLTSLLARHAPVTHSLIAHIMKTDALITSGNPHVALAHLLRTFPPPAPLAVHRTLASLVTDTSLAARLIPYCVSTAALAQHLKNNPILLSELEGKLQGQFPPCQSPRPCTTTEPVSSVSWNVRGLQSSSPSVSHILATHTPDIFVAQELKMAPHHMNDPVVSKCFQNYDFTISCPPSHSSPRPFPSAKHVHARKAGVLVAVHHRLSKTGCFHKHKSPESLMGYLAHATLTTTTTQITSVPAI